MLSWGQGLGQTSLCLLVHGHPPEGEGGLCAESGIHVSLPEELHVTTLPKSSHLLHSFGYQLYADLQQQDSPSAPLSILSDSLTTYLVISQSPQCVQNLSHYFLLNFIFYPVSFLPVNNIISYHLTKPLPSSCTLHSFHKEEPVKHQV